MAIDNSRDLEEPSRMTEGEGTAGTDSLEDLRLAKRKSIQSVTRQVTGLPKKDSMKSMSIYE